MRRIIVGITGATGAIFGIRLLQALRAAEVETHLVLSKWGLQTIEHETDVTADQLLELAGVHLDVLERRGQPGDAVALPGCLGRRCPG